MGALKGLYAGFWFQGRCQKANRVAWILFRGPIPDGLQVLHSCDVTLCVNPGHLFLGDGSDNMQDSIRKGRFNRASGIANGNATLSETQVAEIRSRKHSIQESATLFHVSLSTIKNIRAGRTRCRG